MSIKELFFAPGLLKPSLDGTKKITLRKYREGSHDFVKDEMFRGRFKDGYNVFLRATADTVKKSLGELTDQEAREDGFKDAQDACNGLRNFYPDFGPDDILAIIRYELVVVNGKFSLYEFEN